MSPEFNIGQLFTAVEGQEELSISQLLNKSPKNPQEFNELLASFVNQEDLTHEKNVLLDAPKHQTQEAIALTKIADVSRQAIAAETSSNKEKPLQPVNLELESTDAVILEQRLSPPVFDDKNSDTGANLLLAVNAPLLKPVEAKQSPVEPGSELTGKQAHIITSQPVEHKNQNTKVVPLSSEIPVANNSINQAPVIGNETPKLIPTVTVTAAEEQVAKAPIKAEQFDTPQQPLSIKADKAGQNTVELPKVVEIVPEKELDAHIKSMLKELPEDQMMKQVKEHDLDVRVSNKDTRIDVEAKSQQNNFSNFSQSQSQSQQKGREHQNAPEVKISSVSSAQQLTTNELQTKPVNQKPVVESVNEHLGTEKWKTGFADKIRWFAVNGVKQATVQINPRELGPVAIRLETIDNQMNLHFVTSNESVKAAIDTAQPQIRELLQQNGFDLDNFSSSESSKEQAREDHGASEYLTNANEEGMAEGALVEQSIDAEEGVVNLYI